MGVFQAAQGRTFMLRLAYEADLMDAVKRFAEEKKMNAGVFFMIGAVKSARFSFYNQQEKKYFEEKFDEPLEVLSCVGNIAKFKGETLIHSHIVLSDSEGRCLGGHLTAGTKVFAGEVFLVELANVSLEREYDSVTGLNLVRTEP